MRYNIDIKIVRGTESHTEKAIVDSNTVFLPVTADVIEGDLMIRMLPNGREDRMIATEVSVLQSPFGNSALDHTEVKFKSETSANRARTAGVVNNYSAENMQVTAGDSYGMTMNIGYNAEELESLLDGLLSILEANGVQVDQDGETNEVEDSVVLATEASIERLNDNVQKICIGNSSETVAHNLFRIFRECDKKGYKRIILEEIEDKELGLAVMNRAKRAAKH